MQCEEMKNLFLNRPTGIKLGSAVLMTGLITYLKFRPITILVSSVYVTWVYRTFYADYKIQMPKELTENCRKFYENLKTLRQTRPNMFCGFVTSILFLVAIMGTLINGTYILLACLIAGVLLTSKYEIKIIKENDSMPSSGIDVDEFFPQMDEININILNQIGDNADDTAIYSSNSKTVDNESDSDSELLPKNAVIPEPDEIDDAPDEEVNVDDLIIDPQLVLTQSAEYKRKHFSNTSSESSDSDDSITKGLDFKNIPVTAVIEAHATATSSSSSAGLLSNFQNTLARNLIENLMKPKSSQNKTYESDDELSDFEILDTDELK